MYIFEKQENELDTIVKTVANIYQLPHLNINENNNG
ncbi:hypothetical protein FLAT13_04050 [Flavobacterium salmonis]|uniref:Uncharacterized protein n=1 Tax=Flavobacterium salmonis TaxID=2654844 RepID=A0A6V6Z843_9FLAO|nr:hypothetical protein FLAT13_04050 [Flavobacterium salmonis]